jgi:hypothetical protein
MSNKIDIYEEKDLIEGVEISIPKLNLLPLQPYEKMRSELTEITSASGPLFMRDMNRAEEAVAQLAAKVTELRDNAILNSRREKAKAMLNRADPWLKANEMKVTDSMRERYADMDPEARVAAERVNALNALVKILEAKREAFAKAHDDAKKIYDKITNFRGSREGGYSDV